jgi:hypothetical protein
MSKLILGTALLFGCTYATDSFAIDDLDGILVEIPFNVIGQGVGMTDIEAYQDAMVDAAAQVLALANTAEQIYGVPGQIVVTTSTPIVNIGFNPGGGMLGRFWRMTGRLEI